MGKEKIIKELQNTYDGDPWYGHSILKVIQSVDIKNINNAFESGNSLGQIFEHLIAWRNFTVEILKENFSYKIEINSLQDWNKGKQYNQKDWEQLVHQLKESQNAIIKFVESKPNEFLETVIPERNYSYFTMLNNCILHDLYHLGQIALLNK